MCPSAHHFFLIVVFCRQTNSNGFQKKKGLHLENLRYQAIIFVDVYCK